MLQLTDVDKNKLSVRIMLVEDNATNALIGMYHLHNPAASRIMHAVPLD